MATCQRQRTNTGTWSSIFPTEQVTHQQSTLFVKKLLAVAVSNISYLRTIFPEHAFGDRCLEDLNLKILRDDSSCPGACQVIRWMKGCFDALDKKYLQTIVIGIYKDPEDPDTVIESYTFKFSYGDGGGLDIYRNGSKLAGAYSEAETKKATIKLLRTIVVLTQTLKPLPDDVMMTMKLLYYDDVTPSDYQPPGFSTGDQEYFSHMEEVVNIAVGDVATPFHLVKLRIQTSANQFELPLPNEDSNEDKQVSLEEKSKEGIQPKEPNLASDVPMDTDAELPQEGAEMLDLKVTGTSPLIETEMDATQTGNGIRCPCSCNEDDGLMILCGLCNMWQHGVCYGLLREEQVPQLHICELCAQGNSQDEKRQCTDPFLQYLDGMSLQTTCLFRRALLAATEVSKINPTELMKRLGVERSTAQGLVNRLEREGFISRVKGKRVNRIVYKDKLEEGMKRFMLEGSNKKPTTAQREVTPTKDKPTNTPDIASKRDDDCSLNDITEGTKGLSLSKSRVKDMVEEDQQVRRSPRLAKRARALVDQDTEFDLASSQDWSDPNTSRTTSESKKRKVSIAKKSIMV